jgi:dephospho-CoA kinase
VSDLGRCDSVCIYEWTGASLSVNLSIGLTGGLASGKSTVARLFESLGIPVIDADKVARKLVEPGSVALPTIIARFGQGIISPDGSLNRATLREIVFSDDAARLDLEAILHPQIRHQMAEQLQSYDTPYAISMIPLLFESDQTNSFDRILVIDIPVGTQLERAHARDSSTAETLQGIIDAQIDRDSRLAKADDIISNDGTVDALRSQVERLHERYLALASRLRRAE